MNPHKRDNETPSESPYGFSEHFVWRTEDVRPAGPSNIHAVCSPGVEAAYSDRLSEWNRDAFNRACQSVAGPSEFWDQRQASRFLTFYFGKPTKAVALARGCNRSNGYPYWIIWFKPGKDD